MAHEIGTLRALPNGESLFVGSSSGVFFINTVRRAFSHAAAAARRRSPHSEVSTPIESLPSPEECIFGPESQADAAREPGGGMGELPSRVVAKELLMTYFRTWHPLLPFLHGPTCLAELDSLYAGNSDGRARKPSSLGLAVILQCLFNIAKLERQDLPPLGQARIRSEEQLLLALSSLSLKCDLESIQALLAAHLYFVAAMHLHAASTTGGLVLRSIYKSGLHRCPVRYPTFGAKERDMRKRVFWSAYILDRFMSQSLGHPLGIQDSDIDVCPPGQTELHEPVSSVNCVHNGTSPEDTILHLPANHPQRLYKAAHTDTTNSLQTETHEDSLHEHEEEQPYAVPPDQGTDTGHMSQQRCQNQIAQAQFVGYSRLVGRMLETFHKSIHARSINGQDVLFLKAAIEAWGNNLPSTSSAPPYPVPSSNSNSKPGGLNQDMFFEVARQQLLLLVNRPSLSLKPTSAEFRHAIQICIGASRSIIRILEAHLNAQGSLFWPGYMSAVWMSGLIMVFACQLKLHSILHAKSDIIASLRILKSMTQRWGMAQNCHDVLSMLLESTQTPSGPQAPPSVPVARYECRHSSQGQMTPRGEKRSRQEQALDRCEGPSHRRMRLSRQEAQPMRPQRAAQDSEERTHLSQMDSAVFEDIGGKGPAVGLPTTMDPYYISAMQQSNHFDRMPGQFPPQDSMQSSQQAVAGNFSRFADPHVDGWNSTLRTTPAFEPTPVYDVFDGAMWGSLLELMETNNETSSL